ncbi:MAG: hypothetical protein ACRC7N_22295 [Clostridium sp.]
MKTQKEIIDIAFERAKVRIKEICKGRDKYKKRMRNRRKKGR